MGVQVTKAQYGKGKTVITVIVAVLVLLFIVTGIIMKDSLGVDIDEPITVTIARGDGTSLAADKLGEAGAIKYPFIMKLQARMGKASDEIQPGRITVENGMSYTDILNLMMEESRSSVSVEIKPGSTVKEIAQLLEENGLAESENFYAALDPARYDYRFLKNIPQRDGSLEGYLYPASYNIPMGMSEHDIVDLMLKAFDSQFKEEYYQRATELGMSADQIITAASVIERETTADGDKKKAAGVIYNKRNCGMKLQALSTVQYVIGEKKAVVTNEEAATDSPYNTMLYADLPAGPICSPGIAAIEAALYPEATDAYYFAQKSDSTVIYAANYNDFIAAIKDSELMINADYTIFENQDDKIGQTAQLQWNGN